MPSAPLAIFTPATGGSPPFAPRDIFVPAGGGGAPEAPEDIFAPASSTANVAATGSFTVSGSLTSGQTAVINGRTYTSLVPDNGSATAIFSDAAGLATVINGLRAGVGGDSNVSAVAVGNVVTLTARVPGPGGNAITLARTGAAVARSGATLSGGSGRTAPQSIFSPAGGGGAPAAPSSIFTPAGGGGSPTAPGGIFTPAGGGGSPSAPSAVFAPFAPNSNLTPPPPIFGMLVRGLYNTNYAPLRNTDDTLLGGTEEGL
jgi:hypothetical protein